MMIVMTTAHEQGTALPPDFTQRSFELNAQMIQAGDQILQLISNLRR